jgi:hypothetical protein
MAENLKRRSSMTTGGDNRAPNRAMLRAVGFIGRSTLCLQITAFKEKPIWIYR